MLDERGANSQAKTKAAPTNTKAVMRSTKNKAELLIFVIKNKGCKEIKFFGIVNYIIG